MVLGEDADKSCFSIELCADVMRVTNFLEYNLPYKINVEKYTSSDKVSSLFY